MIPLFKTFRKLCCKPKYQLKQNVNRLRSKKVIQENPVPFIDPDLFHKQSQNTLDRLHYAFTDLQQLEPRITQIDFVSQNELSVMVEDLGQYRFVADYDNKIFFLQSPIQGAFKYYFDIESEMWTNNKDSHYMFENLVRELSYQTKGYLDL